MRARKILPGTWRECWAATGITTASCRLSKMAQKGILSFFNKASELPKDHEGKDGGEGDQNGNDNTVSSNDTAKKGRKRKEDKMEDSCGHGPVTDSSESPVRKRKSKRRRVIIDSDDEEEKGEEERWGESEVETSVCGTNSGREGEEKEEEGKGEKVEEGKGEKVEEEEVEEEGEEGKVEGKGVDVCDNHHHATPTHHPATVTTPTTPTPHHVATPTTSTPQSRVAGSTVASTPPKRQTARKHTGNVTAPKSTGKATTRAPKSTGKATTRAPKSTGKATARAPKSTGKATARKHTGKMHSSPRSSKPKSKPPPPKKAKRDIECNSCEGSNVVLEEEEEEKEKEVVAGGSEGVLPETVVGNVKNSDSRPLGSGEEDNEPMDTSEGGGDGGGDRGEEEEGKKEDSSSQVVKKKDNSGIGTAEPTKKKKKQAHPFFAPKTPQKSSSKAAKKADTPSIKTQPGSNVPPSSSSSPKSGVPPSSSSSPAATSVNATSDKSTHSSGGSRRVEAAEYNPAKKDYHPLEDACWQRGEKVPYLAIAKTFERIEEESKRLKIVSTLTNFYRSVILLSPTEMVQCVYLCLNKLAPAYEGLELGIGESLLMKAIAGATGRSVQQIKAEAVEKGDLGIVAESSRSTQRMMFTPPKLMVSAVFAKLKDIASMTGSASTSKKADIIKGLFVACRHSEARYLIRSLGGKLRIGLAEQSVLTAIAHAAVYTPPGQDEVFDASRGCSADKFHKVLEEGTLKVKTSYCEHPNYDALIPALLAHGLDQLSVHCRLTPGVPLKPMLAHPTKGVQEVLRRFEDAKFTCEWKYDGERAQIHVLEGGEIRIYSRNSENNTTKYPDIIARMPKVLKDSVTSCIIDAEAVAWDADKHQILPFQVLSTRKKKGADIADIKVQVCIFAFDIIFLNGKSFVREPFQTRREVLLSSFNEIKGEFMFAQSMDSTCVEQIQEFMEESIKGKCEGLMVKTLDKSATYEIARRSHNWLKLKKDYLEGVGDTLDLVVVGGFHGTGRRTGKYGGFLLACYDEDEEEYQVICKIGTGLTDEQLEKHTEFLGKHIIENPKAYYRCSDGVQPDLWFDSVQVWEVKAADLSISPVYTAAIGIVDPEKGISLRFPRFLRIRDDKKPEEATTSRQVAEMYKNQQNSVKVSGADPVPEDFY